MTDSNKAAYKAWIASAIKNLGPVGAVAAIRHARASGASPTEVYEICRDGLCGGPSCDNPRCLGWVLAYSGDGYPPMVDRCDDCYARSGFVAPDHAPSTYGVPDPSPLDGWELPVDVESEILPSGLPLQV